jgi:thioredoxin-related protein
MTTKVSISLLVFFVAAFALGATATADPYFDDVDKAMQAGQEGEKNVLIKFYTDWCGWCKHIDTTVLNLPEAEQFFTDDMLLVRVNAEVDTMLAQKYSVSAFPTLVLVKPSGEEIDRIVGFMPIDPFLKTLREYEQGIGTLDDLLSKAEAGADRDLYMQIAEKYQYRGGADEAKAWYTKVVDAGEPTDSLSGEARITLADMKRREKMTDEAMADFKQIETDFQGQEFAATAAIWQAIIYRQNGDTTKAIAEFERFVADYPESEDVSYAQKQIEKLKNPPVEDGKS